MSGKIIKLNDTTVAIIKNDGVSIVQELFSNKNVVVVAIDDLKQIIKVWKGVKSGKDTNS